MLPLEFRHFSRDAVGLVTGHSRTTQWRLGKAGKFPKAASPLGHLGSDIIDHVAALRTEAGLKPLAPMDILLALVAAEEVLARRKAEAAPRKPVRQRKRAADTSAATNA